MESNEKGITLTVLVITIIVLVILAGVTIFRISSLGFLNSARKDVQQQYDASVNEALKMNATLANQLEDWGL